MEDRLKVGITHGDVNGVSYELVIKLLAENKICEVCTPIFYGSPKVAGYYRKTLNVENFSLNTIRVPGEANPKRGNIINCVDDQVKVDLGTETTESGQVAMRSLTYALGQLDEQSIEVLVLAPQSDNSFIPSGSRNVTEFLSRRYNAYDSMTILVNEQMKIGFVTGMISLKDVPSRITQKNVMGKLQLLNESLKEDFTLTKPKIAVLGLNPSISCTDTQKEEAGIIIPVLEQAREQGIMAMGPYETDRFFGERMYEKFDAVLAMYYDQGAVPFKMLGETPGIAYMAGLPVVSTFPLESPQYEIAGKNEADEQGLRSALYLGIDIYNNRKQNIALKANPLPHYDISSNSNETDLNVEQIEGVKVEPEDML